MKEKVSSSSLRNLFKSNKKISSPPGPSHRPSDSDGPDLTSIAPLKVSPPGFKVTSQPVTLPGAAVPAALTQSLTNRSDSTDNSTDSNEKKKKRFASARSPSSVNPNVIRQRQAQQLQQLQQIQEFQALQAQQFQQQVVQQRLQEQLAQQQQQLVEQQLEQIKKLSLHTRESEAATEAAANYRQTGPRHALPRSELVDRDSLKPETLRRQTSRPDLLERESLHSPSDMLDRTPHRSDGMRRIPSRPDLDREPDMGRSEVYDFRPEPTRISMIDRDPPRVEIMRSMPSLTEMLETEVPSQPIFENPLRSDKLRRVPSRVEIPIREPERLDTARAEPVRLEANRPPSRLELLEREISRDLHERSDGRYRESPRSESPRSSDNQYTGPNSRQSTAASSPVSPQHATTYAPSGYQPYSSRNPAGNALYTPPPPQHSGMPMGLPAEIMEHASAAAAQAAAAAVAAVTSAYYQQQQQQQQQQRHHMQLQGGYMTDQSAYHSKTRPHTTSIPSPPATPHVPDVNMFPGHYR